MEKRTDRINPAIWGFIAGTEGTGRALNDERWALDLAKRYDVDADSILLSGKTYGREVVEEALAKKEAKA